MMSLGDPPSPQLRGPVVFAPQVEVAGGCFTVLSEMFDGDLVVFQDLSAVQCFNDDNV